MSFVTSVSDAVSAFGFKSLLPYLLFRKWGLKLSYLKAFTSKFQYFKIFFKKSLETF